FHTRACAVAPAGPSLPRLAVDGQPDAAGDHVALVQSFLLVSPVRVAQENLASAVSKVRHQQSHTVAIYPGAHGLAPVRVHSQALVLRVGERCPEDIEFRAAEVVGSFRGCVQFPGPRWGLAPNGRGPGGSVAEGGCTAFGPADVPIGVIAPLGLMLPMEDIGGGGSIEQEPDFAHTRL